MRYAVLLIFSILSLASLAQSNSDAIVADSVSMENEELEKASEKDVAKPSKNETKKLKATSVEGYRSIEQQVSEDELRPETAAPTQAPAGDGVDMNNQLYLQNSSSFEVSRSNAVYQRTQRSPSPVQQAEMNNAVDYFEQTAPESFEYNYYRYAAGNHNTALVGNLSVAEELRPDNSDVQTQFAAYHIITDNQPAAIQYIDQLIESGRLSEGVLDYSEDILNSTPANGTLITHGFDDTYGSYYVQNAKGVRQDVDLVSLDFLQSEEYCERLKAKGFALPQSSQIDVNYFSSFCSMNVGRKLAVSMTTPKEYLQPQMSNFYATGLVFEYHTQEFNNLARNEFLWDNGLSKKVLIEPADEKARKLSSNYLPMLFILRKGYADMNQTKRVEEIDKELDKVGAQCNKYDKVQSLKKAY